MRARTSKDAACRIKASAQCWALRKIPRARLRASQCSAGIPRSKRCSAAADCSARTSACLHTQTKLQLAHSRCSSACSGLKLVVRKAPTSGKSPEKQSDVCLRGIESSCNQEIQGGLALPPQASAGTKLIGRSSAASSRAFPHLLHSTFPHACAG